MERRLQIEPGAYLIAAAGLLLLPLHVLTAMAVAAIVHESFHFFAAKIMGIRVYSLRINGNGCILDMEPMTLGQELLCAAAGPVGSLLLLAAARWFPLLAVCGAVQGCFNLLPLHPLDGGRILYCVVAFTTEAAYADKVCRWVEIAVILLLLGLAICLAWHIDWAFLLGAVLFWGAGRFGKMKNSLQTGATQGTIELPFSKR